VDFDYFHPNDDAAVRPNSCVFVGALDYKPNVDGVTWFCDNVWPTIVEKLPDAQFTIVGRRPVEAVKRLVARRGVRIVADVPDVRPYLWEAAVAVAPLQVARGVQNKEHEAMACGKAMVVSPEALAGLSAVDGVHLIVARAERQWSATLDHLFQDAPMQDRLALACRRYVKDSHRWEACLSPIRELIQCHRTKEVSGAKISEGSGLCLASDLRYEC
jgi:glycosyltransferase involved in cell wall biosynthesis